MIDESRAVCLLRLEFPDIWTEKKLFFGKSCKIFFCPIFLLKDQYLTFFCHGMLIDMFLIIFRIKIKRTFNTLMC